MPAMQTMNTDHAACGDVAGPAHAISGRRCPYCSSWETHRHVEGFRVWFKCDRCGGVFN